MLTTIGAGLSPGLPLHVAEPPPEVRPPSQVPSEPPITASPDKAVTAIERSEKASETRQDRPESPDLKSDRPDDPASEAIAPPEDARAEGEPAPPQLATLPRSYHATTAHQQVLDGISALAPKEALGAEMDMLIPVPDAIPDRLPPGERAE